MKPSDVNVATIATAVVLALIPVAATGFVIYKLKKGGTETWKDFSLFYFSLRSDAFIWVETRR